MKRQALLSLIAMLVAMPSHAAVDWSSLWRNADQRGEQLLRNGDAANAAKTFSDPRRRAFAESQAGDNEGAVRDLTGFDDSDAHYNRGNALARSGKLDDALKAYDSALERDPHNEDARHNRDLVAHALDQQKQQNQQQSQNGQSGDQNKGNDGNGNKDQNGDKGNNGNNSQTPSKGESKNESKGDNGAQQSQGKQQDQQQAQSGADSGSQKQPDQASSGKGGDQQKDPAAKEGTQQQAGQPDSKESNHQDAASAARAQAGQKDDKQQAKQDVAAGLADAQRTGQRNPASAAAGAQEGGKPGGDPISAGPVSEQKLAEDQWLRRIPDDPGGLLRRKFMIEHMLKQKQSQQDNQP